MDKTSTDLRDTWQNPSSETLHDVDINSKAEVMDSKGNRVDAALPVSKTEDSQGKDESTQMEEEAGRTESKQIITLPLSDPAHPNNWPRSKKFMIFGVSITTVLHSTLASSLPSNAVEFIAREFNVTSQVQLVLPISCFLMGYVCATTLCGPLSEGFGRKFVMLYSFLAYTIFTMCCAVAPNWGSFLFFRFACGVSASAPITCVAGILADIYGDPRTRGRAMSIFMASTVFGSILAPPLSGFVAENTTWRWVFGVAAIFAGLTIPLIALLPETYCPILLHQRAARMRKETGNMNIIAASDLQKKTFNYVVTVVLARPFRMLFSELIVSTTSVYLSLCYGIFYLYFEAYPFIFQGPDSIYKFSPGIAGLTFLPIGFGAVAAAGVALSWEAYLARAQERKAPWSQKEEYRRLPLALIGGPLFAISILWLGWSAREDILWLAPVMSGVAFGAGFILIFTAMLTYLSDAYMTFSASALGIASTCRSLLGVLLPLASHRMFEDLGVSWACSTLAFLCFLLGTVPFLFIKFGARLRANSKFCQELHALHQKELEEKEAHDNARRSV